MILAHGGGGELTKRLIEDHFVSAFSNPLLAPLTDSAVIETDRGRLAFTTDSFTVQPLEFPGGDIGRLAVCGTVNDLAMAGALPEAISLAMIIEEGLAFETLDRIVQSIARAAGEANVSIATGDTKVIENRKGDGMFITTAGIGRIRPDVDLTPQRLQPGDQILINGTLADHGLAVMSVREGLSFQTQLRSDAAPLNHLVQALFEAGIDVKFLRDPTRGGVAGVLCDLVEDTGQSVEINENSLPLSPVSRHTAELLGLDPLMVANEGKCIVVVAESDARRALEVWQGQPLGQSAAIIGQMTDASPALVELVTSAGGRRIVQRPYGEDLPRIC